MSECDNSLETEVSSLEVHSDNGINEVVIDQESYNCYCVTLVSDMIFH